MTKVSTQALPSGALIQGYREAGAYTDCFVTVVAGRVSHARFVEAFYTSRWFKLERLVLALVVAKPSTDADARRLAVGQSDAFAAWTVEARAPDQLLVCDFQSATRSWLMVAAGEGATTLYFGSVVAPRGGARSAALMLGSLGWLHRIYARILLRSAVARLAALPPEPSGA
ncbi:hypothetical protein GVN21_12470 [Caulobacter sp. SLTY]|uniref:hypothetical protein n=1 Tax=Caulobacter sp. SLTY TaxID=2683262 RepID=UPI001412D814|nr:hypothetical protein [Caulobacter sp. SLTY]NBB16173.1 hypothetical protein [Caulobacter sp. SLTY]